MIPEITRRVNLLTASAAYEVGILAPIICPGTRDLVLYSFLAGVDDVLQAICFFFVFFLGTVEQICAICKSKPYTEIPSSLIKYRAHLGS